MHIYWHIFQIAPDPFLYNFSDPEMAGCTNLNAEESAAILTVSRKYFPHQEIAEEIFLFPH
jgi:hypothetical protein